MRIDEEDGVLSHYGVMRRSGRYPWGSGKAENTHNRELLSYINELKAKGMTEAKIAEGMHMTTTQLRAEKSIAIKQQKQADIAMAQRLHDKGLSNVAIGERMGKPESTVRTLLAPGAKDKADVLESTSNMLKEQVAEKGFVDIGRGVELYPGVGVSSTRLSTAAAMLEAQGYEIHSLKVKQVGTGKDTQLKVLCPPGTTQKEVFLNPDKIQQIGAFSKDGGRSYSKFQDPIAVNPKRLLVRYKEDGGGQADGVVYVRPGVDDLSLGGANYAQVRIKVGDGHYIKGMAVYRDDLPDGVDLVFNTNKENTGNKLDALKALKDDPELPFGSIVDQIGINYGSPDFKVTSAMNKVNEQGDWEKWSRTLSSQMLSKQSRALAKSQLDMTYEDRQMTYDDLTKLTNPVVRKKMLEDFASATDSAAVHLKAASLPQQSVHVILPLTTAKPTEVYAPRFTQGDRVVLIRHPHGGPFEIPDLVVNNHNAEGRKLLGKDSQDAIGIHHSVAEKLSGADFDGDTVLVIPNNQGRIKTAPSLTDLKNFDPVSAYPGVPGIKTMENTQAEMGKISNLITDMSLLGATNAELARAVKHSMVVIDAEKKGLNYRLSYNDNNIKQLKEKYQSGGASTLISRKKSQLRVPERKPRPQSLGGPVDRTTGELRYVPTNRINYKTGKPATTKTTRGAEATDAHTLSSGTPMERLYADHSNKLKSLANQARLAAINAPTQKQSPSAKKIYHNEVASLDAQLRIAKANAPLERQAQLLARAKIKAKRQANPNMDDDTRKKVEAQALNEARIRTGARKQRIDITPKEWEAIQAGAISGSKLTEILNNADMDKVREHATPKEAKLMSSAKANRAKSMAASGYTQTEIAKALGVSLTTLKTSIAE